MFSESAQLSYIRIISHTATYAEKISVINQCKKAKVYFIPIATELLPSSPTPLKLMHEAFEDARFTLLSLSMPLLQVFKTTTRYTEKNDVETKMSPGIELGTSRTVAHQPIVQNI